MTTPRTRRRNCLSGCLTTFTRTCSTPGTASWMCGTRALVCKRCTSRPLLLWTPRTSSYRSRLCASSWSVSLTLLLAGAHPRNLPVQALMTRSWFIALNGLQHIFFAIPPAYFLYWGVLRQVRASRHAPPTPLKFTLGCWCFSGVLWHLPSAVHIYHHGHRCRRRLLLV